MTAATAVQPPKLSFERAEALVFDPIPSNRTTAHTALRMLGFYQLNASSAFDEATTVLRDTMIDLFVADVTHDPASVCRLVRALRDGSIGRNPFLHIVLMTWKLEGELVEKALNCGADDLLTRPFSVDFLGARLRAHTETRKPFVITSDYIGPDRRKGRAPEAGAQLMEVPNLMLAKAQDPQWPERSARLALEAIKAGRVKVNAERVRKSAFQIAFLTHSLRDAFKAVAPLDGDLAKLEAVAKDLSARVEGHAAEMDALRLVSALRGDVAGAQSGENVATHVEQLSETAGALLEKLNPERPREALLQEVAAAFAQAKTRRKS